MTLPGPAKVCCCNEIDFTLRECIYTRDWVGMHLSMVMKSKNCEGSILINVEIGKKGLWHLQDILSSMIVFACNAWRNYVSTRDYIKHREAYKQSQITKHYSFLLQGTQLYLLKDIFEVQRLCEYLVCIIIAWGCNKIILSQESDDWRNRIFYNTFCLIEMSLQAVFGHENFW